MLSPAKRGAQLTSIGQPVLTWLHISILGAVSGPCLLHSHNWMYVALSVLQIVVLCKWCPFPSCRQGLQQHHSPTAASQGCAYSREQLRQGDFRLSSLVEKQDYDKAWGRSPQSKHRWRQRPLGFDPDIPMEQTFIELQECSQHFISHCICRTVLFPPSGPACSPYRESVGIQVQTHIFLLVQDDPSHIQREFRVTTCLLPYIQAVFRRCPWGWAKKLEIMYFIWGQWGISKVPGCASQQSSTGCPRPKPNPRLLFP